jgi:hypothetical protein
MRIVSLLSGPAIALALLGTTPSFAQTATAPGVESAKPGRAARAPRAKREPTMGQLAARERQKKCGAEWKEAKASGKTGGLKWPKFWSQCNARLKAGRPKGPRSTGNPPIRPGLIPADEGGTWRSRRSEHGIGGRGTGRPRASLAAMGGGGRRDRACRSRAHRHPVRSGPDRGHRRRDGRQPLPLSVGPPARHRSDGLVDDPRDRGQDRPLSRS